MSDYTETFTKVDGNTIEASDFETEFTAIETAIATKFDKNTSFGSNYAGGAITRETVTATTSGTEKIYTGLPSWVRRITIQFEAVSGSGSHVGRLSLGDSGGLETTGYDYDYTYFSGTSVQTAGATNASHIQVYRATDAASEVNGRIVIENITGNVWVVTGTVADNGQTETFIVSGSKTLSGTLTQLRVYISSGAWDAGQLNIMYEG